MVWSLRQRVWSGAYGRGCGLELKGEGVVWSLRERVWSGA